MPRLLPKLQEASRAKELGALKTMLGASASYQEFLKWGSSLSNRYVSPSPTAISSFTNTVGLDGLRETQTTDTVLRGKSVDLKSRWESLKAGLLEYAVSREDTQTQINNLENGRKVVVGELTLAQQREADRLRQDQLYQTATEKRDAGDFDAALAICKTNTGRFATLSNEVFVWRAKLNEMSNSLASGTYADVLANTAYAERAPFTSIFGRARAGTNALATARGHLAGCEFDEARKVMVGYAQVPAFKEMWSQATNGLALLKELGALQSAANYPAILNRLRSESSACFTNYGARAAAYLDATNRFQAEEYDKAAALCGQHESYPGFKELLADIKAEQAALGGLKASLDAGEYEKFLNTYGVSKYKARTNFAGLNKVAVAENTQWQALLKATNNWDQANAAFGALPAELQRKPPFQEIRRWLDMNNPVAKLDAQLELYKVYFGVSKPSAKVVDPATGKSAERLSNVQMEHINYIRKLRSDYQALKQLTPEREAALKDIETKIIRAAGA
jgi:hypothetical protein